MPTSSKSIITASLVLPLLLVACDRTEQSPTTGAGSSQEKPAMTPSTSPADLSKNPVAPSSSAPATSEMAPADQKTEPKKGY